ncbi:hypothetical protein BJF84_10855 [Rhodococcus sp. CUA-806]|nr:hypothetical protein BJF84_10855 [Rhodococcus sp. CUA-806]
MTVPSPANVSTTWPSSIRTASRRASWVSGGEVDVPTPIDPDANRTSCGLVGASGSGSLAQPPSTRLAASSSVTGVRMSTTL